MPTVTSRGMEPARRSERPRAVAPVRRSEPPRAVALELESPARGTAGRHTIIAVYDLVFGCGGLVMIWFGLPARWWPIDTFGTALCVTLIAVGIGLLMRVRHSERAALAAASLMLATGGALVVTILVRAKELTELYGQAGSGGAAVLIAALSFLVPYLVVLPAGQVVFLLRSDDDRF